MPMTPAERREKQQELAQRRASLDARLNRQAEDITPKLAQERALQQKTGQAVASDEGSTREENFHREVQTNQRGISSDATAIKQLERSLDQDDRASQRPGATRGQLLHPNVASLQHLRSAAQGFVDGAEYRNYLGGQEMGIRKLEPVKFASPFGSRSQLQRPLEGTRDYGVDTLDVARYLDTGKVIEPRRRMPLMRQIMSEILDLSDEHITKGVEYDEETAEYHHWTWATKSESSSATTIDLDNAQPFSTLAGFNKFKIYGVGTEYTISNVALNANGSGTLTFAPGLSAGVALNAVVVSENPMYFGGEGLRPAQFQNIHGISLWPSAKISVMIKTTIERLKSRRWVTSKLTKDMPRSLAFKEDNLTFNGPVNAGYPTGLMKDARIPLTTRASLAGYKEVDTLLAMIAEVHKREYLADIGLINPDSMLRMAIERGADRHIVLAEMFMTGKAVLWEVPIRTANILADPDSIVGEFNYGIDYYAQNQSEIMIGTADKEIETDKRTLLQRHYIAMPITHANAFQRGNLAAP